MNDAKLLLQRHLDGELEYDAGRSVQASLAGNQDLSDELARLEGLQSAFDELSTSKGDHQQVDSIMRALPASAPRRSGALRAADLIMAAALMLCITVVFSLLAEMEGFLPLSLVTAVSLGIGAMLLLLAEPLRQVESGLVSRLLRKQVVTAGSDTLVVRAAGLAFIIGAALYTSHVL